MATDEILDAQRAVASVDISDVPNGSSEKVVFPETDSRIDAGMDLMDQHIAYSKPEKDEAQPLVIPVPTKALGSIDSRMLIVGYVGPETDVQWKMKAIFDFIKSMGSLCGKIESCRDHFKYKFVRKYEKKNLLSYLLDHEDTLWINLKDKVGVKVLNGR